MVFNKRNDFDMFLKKEYIREIGSGSQGICYYNFKTKDVYKIFYQYFDDDEDFYIEYTSEEFMRFSNIINDTYVFANDVIIVEDKIVGYVTNYVMGKLLSSINPLYVNLDKLSLCTNKVFDDNEKLALNGVRTHDVLYNIMYGRNGFKIIDFAEYSFSNASYDEIKRSNDRNFNEGVMKFLVDGYFDEFVLSNEVLKNMYLDNDTNVNEFIVIFKKILSEYMSCNVDKLCNAKKCLNKKLINKDYERSFNLR